MDSNINIRKANEKDLDAVVSIYDRVHDLEEKGSAVIGWVRGVYPVRQTAENACNEGTLFVLELNDKVCGTAIINQYQLPEYYDAKWKYPAEDHEVMVLHTLIIDPLYMNMHLGQDFVTFYESYSREHGCKVLRLDTQEKRSSKEVL